MNISVGSGWSKRTKILTGIAVTGPALLVVGLLTAVRYTSRSFWDVAAQPVATAFTGIGAVTAACLILLNGHLGRLDERRKHEQLTLQEREQDLRERYTTIATQIGDPSAAVRNAGIHALIGLDLLTGSVR